MYQTGQMRVRIMNTHLFQMTIEGRPAQSYNQKLQQVECVTTADDVWATLKICQDATQQQLVPLWSWNSGC